MPGVIPPQRQDFVLPFAEVHENNAIEATGCETHWGSSLFPKKWTEYIER